MVSRRLGLVGAALSAGMLAAQGCISERKRYERFETLARQFEKYNRPETRAIVISTNEYLGIVRCEKPTFYEWAIGERFPSDPYLLAVLDTRVISQEDLGIGAHAEDRIGALQRPDLTSKWKIYYTGRLLDPSQRTPEENMLLKTHKSYEADQQALEAMRGWNLAPLLNR